MMGLTKEEITFALGVLEHYKSYFGFADWKVRLDDKTDSEDSGCYAAVDCDVYQKTMVISLFPKYRDDKDTQFESLIHELVHGRLGVASTKIDDRVEQIKYHEEEDAVNDVVRGFLKCLKLDRLEEEKDE